MVKFMINVVKGKFIPFKSFMKMYFVYYYSSQILQRMVEEYADSVYKMAYRMGIPVKSLEPEDAQDEKTGIVLCTH